jgi:hypothetical protein
MIVSWLPSRTTATCRCGKTGIHRNSSTITVRKKGHYGAGIGFLTDVKEVLSTYYPGNAASFERILGEGYFRKTVKSQRYEIDQDIFAPFGDDPVLLSTATLTNHGSEAANLRWVGYWGCLKSGTAFGAPPTLTTP